MSQKRAMEAKPSAGVTQYEWIFGGTFDPVHLGHLAMLEALQRFSPGTPTRLIPCAIPPLKSQPQCSFADRVAMLQLATHAFQGVILDTREKLRDKPSYTVDTLDSLAKDFPSTGFILVMGMDSLTSLRKWHAWQRLSQLCHLLVINRPGSHQSDVKDLCRTAGFTLVTSYQALTANAYGNAVALNMAEMPQSSTEIRDAINKGKPLDSLLSQSVIEYISKNHLYKE